MKSWFGKEYKRKKIIETAQLPKYTKNGWISIVFGGFGDSVTSVTIIKP